MNPGIRKMTIVYLKVMSLQLIQKAKTKRLLGELFSLSFKKYEVAS